MMGIGARAGLAAGAFLLAAIACPARAAARPALPVICYVETLFGGATGDTLDLGPCTHLVESFAIPSPDGALRTTGSLPRTTLIARAHAHGLRVLVSVGGATTPAATFSAIASPGAVRHRFLAELSALVLRAGYDGVDLDWEFPTAREREAHRDLTAAIRASLDRAFSRAGRRARPVLTVALSPGSRLLSYDLPSLAHSADYCIQLGYDFRNPALGPWAHTAALWPDGATAPIEASVRGVATWLVQHGLPRRQLIIALPLYASDGKPWVTLRMAALANTTTFDPQYLETPLADAWITDPAAMRAKVRAIIRGHDIDGGAAGGVALWQLGHQGRTHDLTDAVARALADSGRH